MFVFLLSAARAGDAGLVYGRRKGHVESHLMPLAQHDRGLWHIVFPFLVLLQKRGVT